MPVVNVFFNTLTDHLLVGLQQVGVIGSHFGGNLVSDVNQLPEIGVVVRMPGNMAERIGKFFTAPCVHLFSRRKLVCFDVDDVSIRCA